MRSGLFLSLLLLSLVSSPARGQKVRSPLGPGARARVLAPELPHRTVIGILAAAGADALVLVTRGGAQLMVPRASIQRLAVSNGRSWRLGGFRGMRIGAGTGALAAVVVALTQPGVLAGLALVLAGAAAGAAVGYLVGGSLGAERWVELPESAVRV